MKIEDIITDKAHDVIPKHATHPERDAIELANFIINKLDANPHYVPSETLLRAIRTINDKLFAGDSSLHGVIRSA